MIISLCVLFKVPITVRACLIVQKQEIRSQKESASAAVAAKAARVEEMRDALRVQAELRRRARAGAEAEARAAADAAHEERVLDLQRRLDEKRDGTAMACIHE